GGPQAPLPLGRRPICGAARAPPGSAPAVTGLDPCLVAVNHDRDAIADGAAHGGDDGEILGRVGTVEAELDGRKAFVERPLDVFDALLGRPYLGRRAVDPWAGGVAAPEAVNGQAGPFAAAVPHRYLHAVERRGENLRISQD